MKIGEVEKLTGLSAKAIRLYEEKGLIAVGREENQYRDYNRETTERLLRIKQFREAGIGVTQIALYFNGVITLQELLNERLAQIQKASTVSSDQIEKCKALLQTGDFDTDLAPQPCALQPLSVGVGIDIGTTNISAVLIDIKHKTVLDSYTVPNNALLRREPPFSEYDGEWILEKVRRLLEFFCARYSDLCVIGFTGQMHGVLCVDAAGRAVTPLYNWQDLRANIPLQGKNCCERIQELTGHTLYGGYGLATLYYNHLQGILPKNAHSFATVMDYVAASLAGRSEMVMHPTNAASVGLFDVAGNRFDTEAYEKLGLPLRLPKVLQALQCIGQYKGIPVTVAIGDNQASFYGSVREEENTLLINYGTGSQISAAVLQAETPPTELELRPYLNGKYLLCGCALCGGQAYAVLEQFFARYISCAGGMPGGQYEVMNRLAEQAYGGEKLKVRTTFAGTRSDPKRLGGITGIKADNFMPETLILGVLQGMVDELFSYYQKMPVKSQNTFVASGNVVQKNSVLKRLLQDTFQGEVQILQSREEAALGAVLSAAVAVGLFTETTAKEFIEYKQTES